MRNWTKNGDAGERGAGRKAIASRGEFIDVLENYGDDLHYAKKTISLNGTFSFKNEASSSAMAIIPPTHCPETRVLHTCGRATGIRECRNWFLDNYLIRGYSSIYSNNISVYKLVGAVLEAWVGMSQNECIIGDCTVFWFSFEDT